MTQRFFSSADRPAYHDGMLIMKMRSGVVEPRAEARRGIAANIATTPGLSALAALERGGMLKRVMPLSEQAEERARSVDGRRGIAALMEPIPEGGTDVNAGVNIVELEKSQELASVQQVLASDPNVEFVARVPVRYLVARANPRPSAGRPRRAGVAALPPSATTLWNLNKIQWSQARARADFREAEQVRVAVLDTGIDRYHPDLNGRVVHYSYLHPDLLDASGEKDIVGHGTHVAGTIAALINNRVGINGICMCQLFAWKIFTDVPEFFSFDEGYQYFVDPIMYRRALAQCLDQQIQVVNLSIGGGGEPDRQELDLFRALLANGTTIVAAMGNERRRGSPTSYPAAIPGVIAVGATTIDDSIANFSNRGSHITLCAPGVGIWSTLPTYPGQFGFEAVRNSAGRPIEGRRIEREVNYDSWPGTSMATPHVAASAALLLANKGQMSPADVRTQLQATADHVSGMGNTTFHPDYGAGRLNLMRLLT